MCKEITIHQIYFELYKYIIEAYDLGLVKVKKNQAYGLDYEYYYSRANEDYLNKVVNLNNFAKVSKEPLEAKELKKAKKALKLAIKDYRKNTYNNYFEKME